MHFQYVAKLRRPLSLARGMDFGIIYITQILLELDSALSYPTYTFFGVTERFQCQHSLLIRAQSCSGCSKLSSQLIHLSAILMPIQRLSSSDIDIAMTLK